MKRFELSDLAEARKDLALWEEKQGSYEGMNLRKFSSQIHEAERRVERIKAALRKRGVDVPPEPGEDVEFENLMRELDAAFPRACSRETVLWKGKRYRRRFYPAELSRSGKTVKRWEKWWELVSG